MVITTERPRLLLPGLLPADPYRETYRVKPGGVTSLTLAADDRLTIVHPDGGSPAELTILAPNGRPDFAALGAAPDMPAVTLAASGVALGDPTTQAMRLFGDWSPRGSSVSFRAERTVLVAIANPPGAFLLDEAPAMPASDLVLEVRRSVPRRHEEAVLPPPLAAPRLDFQIDRTTAQSYEVKAGEYIQVIDVEGRQCSDFLAFNRSRLEDGVERGLDATVTRTLMGNAYPRPGLHGKFYDQDMVALVEVVRDTVGRHDTFGLACNPRYYEELGYFGHLNCTDNFNAAIEPFAIAPRKGWPALNLFFNTMFTSENILVSDEPWSRPGDYVLFRAMTDLVCASSACPDDVDPANAWDPTDVHVRVYSGGEKFSAAISRRVTPESEPQLTKETGFQPKTSQLTSRFTEYSGYWLPTAYNNHGAIDEYWACREAAAVMDLSPLRKFEVLGPDAEALLQWTVTRDIARLSVGQVVYTAVCYPTGGMVDDATVFRLGQDNFRLVGGSDYDGVWLRRQAEERGLDRVWVKESTDSLHNIAVQGPKSRELLAGLFWTSPTQTPFDQLTWFRFSVARLADSQGQPVLVSRTGYSGELGYEIWCHPHDAGVVWDAVWRRGEPAGLKPLGLEALNMLRIEAGLISAGFEFDDQTDPFEAGIGFTVPETKDADYSGKAALEQRRTHPQRRLVGLELEGNEVAASGDCVHVSRMQVGVITSATRSPVLKKNISLSRMHVDFSAAGTAVEVGKLDSQQKRIPATVVGIPFYDPDKTRPRS